MSTGISPIKSTNRHSGAIFNLYSVEIRRAVAEISSDQPPMEERIRRIRIRRNLTNA